MNLERKLLACSVVLGIFVCAGTATAQESFSNLTCRAGTVTGLAKTEEVLAFSIDQRGLILADDAAKNFHNNTQRCVGSVAVVRGKPSGGGFCKSVDAASGDIVVSDWTAGDKPGAGTFRFLSGTGKWKGITGGGDYQVAAPTRPVDEGTYQNCVRIKGTFSVPKL